MSKRRVSPSPKSKLPHEYFFLVSEGRLAIQIFLSQGNVSVVKFVVDQRVFVYIRICTCFKLSQFYMIIVCYNDNLKKKKMYLNILYSQSSLSCIAGVSSCQRVAINCNVLSTCIPCNFTPELALLSSCSIHKDIKPYHLPGHQVFPAGCCNTTVTVSVRNGQCLIPLTGLLFLCLVIHCPHNILRYLKFFFHIIVHSAIVYYVATGVTATFFL